MVALSPPSSALSPPSSSTFIKVLDLLTNRYYSGIVRAITDSTLDIELPLTSRLSPGQRVHFVLAHPTAGIIPRRTMRSALVRHVCTTAQSHLRINLTPAAEPVTA
jgi:hypothetical protein